MLTERSIINFLIWTTGLIAGPYLAIASLSGNYVPGLAALGVTFVVVVFAGLRDKMSAIPLIATYCVGKFNFLPMKIGPPETAILALLFYYAVTYLALRRKLMRRGPWLFFIPIVAIALIIMSDEPHFGLHVLGGAREGGRGSLFIALSALAYLCGVSMNSPSPKFMSRIPVYCLIGLAVSSLPYIITTYIPSTSAYFFLISEDINLSAYTAGVMNSDELVRNQGQGQVGAAIVICLLAYFPISSWWQPRRSWIIALVLACAFLVVMGGYRSGLAGFCITAFLLLWCQYTWRAALLIPPALIALALLVTAHDDHLISLPLSAQRTLEFLPGDWDQAVLSDTKGSNDFRAGIIRVYNEEFARVHPWLGNGLSFDTAEFQMYGYLVAHDTPDAYFLHKEFITAKMFHTGYLSLYDSIGIIGSFFFVLFGSRLIFVTGRAVLRKPVDRHGLLFPVKAWLFATATGNIISFFTLFGDIKATFPTLCCLAIVHFHVDHLERLGFDKVPVPREVPFKAQHSRVPLTV